MILSSLHHIQMGVHHACLSSILSFHIFFLTTGALHALEVGDQLPGFRLQDVDGNLHTEETHKGHVLILYFFGHD